MTAEPRGAWSTEPPREAGWYWTRVMTNDGQYRERPWMAGPESGRWMHYGPRIPDPGTLALATECLEAVRKAELLDSTGGKRYIRIDCDLWRRATGRDNPKETT